MPNNQTLSLKYPQIPLSIHKGNINNVVSLIETYDYKADRAYNSGKLAQAERFAQYVQLLDAKLATLSDKSPIWAAINWEGGVHHG